MKIKATFLHIFLGTLVIALTGCANSERKGAQEEKTFDLMKATGPDIQKIVLGLIAYGPPTTVKRKAQIATEFTQDGRSHASQLKRLGRTEDEIYSLMAKKYDLELSAEVNRWYGTLFTLSSEGAFIIPASIPRCSVSCDHIPRRSWALFRARDVMRGVIESFKAEQAA